VRLPATTRPSYEDQSSVHDVKPDPEETDSTLRQMYFDS